MKIALVFNIIVSLLLFAVGGYPIDNEEVHAAPGETSPLPDSTTIAAIATEPAKADGSVPDNPAPPVATSAPMKTKCECAVFNTEAPTEKDQPIISQTPIDVTCDAQGEENCLKMCSALAKAAEERAPQLLCAHVGHYNRLRASVHSRICTANKWTYTGLSAPTEICCHEHKVVDCKDLADVPPANQL